MIITDNSISEFINKSLLTDKIEIVALSKFDLSKSNHKDLIKRENMFQDLN